VTEKIIKFCDDTIWISYFALATITPLIFSTHNSELFELPKMIFVYFGATIIFFLTAVKFVLQRKIAIPNSLPVIVLVIFLTFQVLSTFFSIDKFTSIFGYPSRLNGGLLSTFAYLTIFAGVLINLSFDKARKLIIAMVLTAFVVSLWGISSNFGKDPSCLVLTGKLTSTCWQKEFNPTLRIFATLGQPNWLASYLVIILPFSIALAINFTQKQPRVFFTVVTLVIFTALVMTTSRAGFLGAAISLGLFLLMQASVWRQTGFKMMKQNLHLLLIMLLGFLLITTIFGTNLISRFGEALTKNQKSTSQSVTGNQQPETSSQQPVVNSAPTESFQIRLIVWQGALKIFQRWPILGSGPETFAYSYYLFRPTSHNQTTEWNFFYNKAHNEFLNYLANSGILGTSAYLAFIIISIITIYRIGKKKSGDAIFFSAAIGAIVGYQITIFFGFSVVTTGLLMFMILAIFIVPAENFQEINLGFLQGKLQKITTVVLAIFGVYVIILVVRIYFADLFFTRAQELDPSTWQSFSAYSNAIGTFPAVNPFYLADYAYENALYVTNTDDPKLAKTLIKNTKISAEKALRVSPNNLIIARKIANAYFLISDDDEESKQEALTVGQRLIKLAPTDPQFYLTFAKIQAGLGQEAEAKKTLMIALSLKPDYQDAQELMTQLTTGN